MTRAEQGLSCDVPGLKFAFVYLIVNNATISFHKIPNETFNLNLKSRHIFEFEKPKFQFERKRK